MSPTRNYKKFVLLRVDCSNADLSEDIIRLQQDIFEHLTEKQQKAVWAMESDLLALQCQNVNVVYILPVFSGAVFSHLHKLSARIYGTPAVYECIINNKRLPKWKHPIYSLAFSGAVVCFGGVSPGIKEKAIQYVRFMNGIGTRQFLTNVTHLVAPKCQASSKKYQQARRAKLPVLTLQWLESVWEANLQGVIVSATEEESMEPFKTQLFSGCVISLSGYHRAERESIETMVQQNGGVYTGDLRRDCCTHLITERNSGVKYASALEWKTVEIVTLQWLYKSAEAGYRLKEEHFRPGSAPKISTPEHPSAVRQPMEPNVSAIHRTSTDPCLGEFPDVSSRVFNASASFLAGPSAPPAVATSFAGVAATSFVAASFAQNASENSKTQPEKTSTQTNTQAGHSRTYPEVPTASRDADDSFDEPFEAAGESAVLPITASSTRSRAMEEMPLHGKSCFLETAREDNINRMETPAGLNPLALVAQEETVQWDTRRETLSQKSQGVQVAQGSISVLNGLTFRIGHVNDQEASELYELIEAYGGTVQVNKNVIVDYFVVPLLETDNELLQEKPRFHHLRSTTWLQSSIRKGQLLNPSVHPLCQPIIGPPPNEVKPFENCVVALSGFDFTTRESFRELLEIYGAIVQNALVRSARDGHLQSTHLVAGSATDRVEIANKWQLPVVDPSWVLESIVNRRQMSVAEFTFNDEAFRNYRRTDIIQQKFGERSQSLPNENEEIHDVELSDTPSKYFNGEKQFRLHLSNTQQLREHFEQMSDADSFHIGDLMSASAVGRALTSAAHITDPAHGAYSATQVARKLKEQPARLQTQATRNVNIDSATRSTQSVGKRNANAHISQDTVDMNNRLVEALQKLKTKFTANSPTSSNQNSGSVQSFPQESPSNVNASNASTTAKVNGQGKTVVPRVMWKDNSDVPLEDFLAEAPAYTCHQSQMRGGIPSELSTQNMEGNENSLRASAVESVPHKKTTVECDSSAVVEDTPLQGGVLQDLNQQLNARKLRRTLSKDSPQLQRTNTSTRREVDECVEDTPNVEANKPQVLPPTGMPSTSCQPDVDNLPWKTKSTQRVTTSGAVIIRHNSVGSKTTARSPNTKRHPEENASICRGGPPAKRALPSPAKESTVEDTVDTLSAQIGSAPLAEHLIRRQPTTTSRDAVASTSNNFDALKKIPPPNGRLFGFTSVPAEERDKLVGSVNRHASLSATFLLDDAMTPEMTHLICGKPVRNEKFLCALASGKWIVTEEYIVRSVAVGRWLPEAEFEIGCPRNLGKSTYTELSKKLAKAARRWRTALSKRPSSPRRGAFAGWKVLMYISENKATAMCHVIETGGGTPIRRELYKGKNFGEFTHVLVENSGRSGWNEEEMIQLASAGVKCFSMEYISTYLIEENPSTEVSLHPDYRNYMAGHDSDENSCL